jgi:hypothetical protein
VQHLAAQPVEHGEADVGSILGRVDVNAEGPLAERAIDDFDNSDGDG